METRQVCRLCLENSIEFVDIYGTFENLTIASIIEQHFRFQIYDGSSSLLCKKCWDSTKTFHQFYETIELRQRNYFQSICNAVVKVEPSESEPPPLHFFKSEEVEFSEKVIAEPIQYDNRMDDDNIDYSNVDDNDLYNTSTNERSNQDGQGPEQLPNDKGNPKKLESKNRVKRVRQLKGRAQRLLEEDAQIRMFCRMECDTCSEKFATFSEARKHYQNAHNASGYLTCCDVKFRKRERLVPHIRQHLNLDVFNCHICGKTFEYSRALKRHIENHQSIYSRPFKCNICSYSFVQPSILAQHQRITHCSEEDKKFICDICNKRYITKALLAFHIRRTHLPAVNSPLVRKLVCDICAHVFTTTSNFKRHMDLHANIAQPKLQCSICGHLLAHKESLKKHMKRHQEKAEKCPLCDKVMRNKDCLRGHIQNVHGERSHQCSICDKSFTRSITLKEHMALHTGEDLYKCPYCTKTSKSISNMYQHRKKVHPTEYKQDRMKRLPKFFSK